MSDVRSTNQAKSRRINLQKSSSFLAKSRKTDKIYPSQQDALRNAEHAHAQNSQNSKNTHSFMWRLILLFSKIIPSNFKAKHIFLIPVFILVQTCFYMMYINHTEKLTEDRINFLNQHLDLESAMHWGDYRIKNFFKNASTLEETNPQDITLTSQCSVDNLHYLVSTSAMWRGPISIAVFAPQNDAVLAIYAINSLRKCFPMIRDLITFHLVWPTNKSPEYIKDPPIGLFSDECEIVLETLKNGFTDRINYEMGTVLYPHNTLRNVARYKLLTNLMFMIDIDTVPALSSRDQFLDFAQRRGLWDENQYLLDKIVYVTPAWEVPTDVDAPKTKQILLDLLDAERVRPFHNETCWYCHKASRYEDWAQIPMAEKLAIAYEVDWEKSWEPYYISSTEIPFHDERFKQYGYDRISQICELYMAEYRFFVLNNIFTVHQGYKKLADVNLQRNLENRKNFLIFEERFQPEMTKKYPNTTKTCVQKESWKDSRKVVINNIERILKERQKRSII